MLLRTDAVFPVPVQLVAGRTGTLVASQRVDAAVLAASAVYTALIDVWERHICTVSFSADPQLSFSAAWQKYERKKKKTGTRRSLVKAKLKQEQCFKLSFEAATIFQFKTRTTILRRGWPAANYHHLLKAKTIEIHQGPTLGPTAVYHG